MTVTPLHWSTDLRPGASVELVVYGDRMEGRLESFSGDTLRVRIPIPQQVSGLQLSTAHGTATVAIEGGAANLPVSCWPVADVVRLQVIGPVEYIQRRRFTRYQREVPVTLAWAQSTIGAWQRVVTSTVDLSMGGLRVNPASTVWPDAGAKVLISVDLPDGPFHAEAQVVGKTPDYGLRLEFAELHPELEQRLTALTG